jgi:fumarylacetoacetate (FAA) hydrolase family protein
MISFICFTNPLRIHTYFREDRVKGIFFIERRGKLSYYSAGQLIEILQIATKKKMKAISEFLRFPPRFTDTFPKYDGRLKALYDAQKDKGIDDFVTALGEKYIDESIKLSPVRAKFLNMCRSFGSEFTITECSDEANVTPVRASQIIRDLLKSGHIQLVRTENTSKFFSIAENLSANNNNHNQQLSALGNSKHQ